MAAETPVLPASSVMLDNETLGSLTVVRPEGEAKALVFLVADAAHIAARTARSDALLKAGAIVVTFDLERYKANAAAEPKEDETACHYLAGDIEDAAAIVERELQLPKYLFPAVAGLGEGASLAYMALLQAPDNTLSGAVSEGFEPIVRLDRPYCFEPTPTGTNGVYTLINTAPLPGGWRVVAQPSEITRIDSFQKPLIDAKQDVKTITAESEPERIAAFTAAVMDIGVRGDRGLADLPLSIIRPKGPATALAVIISGDGGWRDIDKSIGDWLADNNIAVVGIDSLRYFWSQKTPDQIGDDLDTIFKSYGHEFQTKRYVLIGYSFGANIIPFAWPELGEKTRERIALISLLGLSPSTEFEITVDGYLGRASPNSKPVLSVAAKLPFTKTQCFYGEEEDTENETFCTAPEMKAAEVIKVKGGHHFDGDYESLAARIKERIDKPRG